MLTLIHAPVAAPDPALPAIELRAERLKLAKRVWRGAAADGTEFGFKLVLPLRPGETFWQTETARYVLVQEPEPVLEISLDLAPSAAAGIGWAVGNLHLELMAEATRLLTPDDKAARQLFERLQVTCRETTAVFRPGRFARGAAGSGAAIAAQELGSSHRH